MENNILKKISRFIVEKRILLFALFGAAVVFCALSVGKVQINKDIKSLLPKDTVTKRGIAIMEEEFETFASANIMVSDILYDEAEELAEELKTIQGVSTVGFNDTKEHYTSGAALFSVSFSGAEQDEQVIAAMKEVEELLADYDVSISSSIGQDYTEKLAGEMGGILLLAVIVIMIVLLFTSKSYFEVVILLIVFAVAAVLNMGTNYLLGEISSITNSVAIILQLALAIDYAIILCHRFQDEYDRLGEVKTAMINSLAYSIIEISSSSLTTIAGLLALTLMQFRLGYDLGRVLIKGIFCSLFTVFLLMPGLIMVFHKALIKTRHKRLVPDISAWGRFLSNRKPFFLILFLVSIPFVYVASSRCEYTFSESATDRITLSEQDKIEQKIYDTFDETNTIAVIAPSGDYEKEKKMFQEISKLPQIKSAVGLAGIEIEDGKVLTDLYTPQDFSELVGVDIGRVKILYSLYGYRQNQSLAGSNDTYGVPLLDMIEFLLEAVDKGVVALDEKQTEMIHALRQTLEDALLQLRGEHYIRQVYRAAVPVEGEESTVLVNQISDIAAAIYGEDDILVIGDITSAKDLKDSFSNDNQLVSWLTILFVFLVLLFTFHSFGTAILLILVIQGSIWINFSFPYLTDTNVFFVTYLIVVAIQMGATIDYAIIIYNRFLTHKSDMKPKQAMSVAVNESFPTVLTSGTIMAAAGFIIAYRTTDLYISSIGLALGRGVTISILLVMTVLPQLLLAGNQLMEKTTFHVKKLIGPADDKDETA